LEIDVLVDDGNLKKLTLWEHNFDIY
jgi:hypothetical protein